MIQFPYFEISASPSLKNQFHKVVPKNCTVISFFFISRCCICPKTFCLLLRLRQIFVLAVVSIYFGSVIRFMNGSCNFARFIKYNKNRFTINFPWSCRTLQNNSVFWPINVIYRKKVIQSYSQISGNFILNKFPSK